MARCLTRGTVASFMRAFVCHSHISLMKALDVFTFQILRSLSFFIIYCKTTIFTHTHLYRFQSTLDPTGNDSATAIYDFENPINLAEDEGEDDCEVPGELARLLLQEERAIQPHEEPVETVNLGTEIDRW